MRTFKPAPPAAERPVCMGCGKALSPMYSSIFLSDGTKASAHYNPTRPDDEVVRVWTGEWRGYPHVSKVPPLHCAIGCAATHGSRLVEMMMIDNNQGVVLSDEGQKRAKLGRGGT